MSVAIEISALTHRYAAAAVLEDVSLTVAAGDLLTVLGPSGSGKSTLLALIAGIANPEAGDIRFGGTSVLGVPAAARGTALVLQQAYLFPYLTVGENVAFGLAARGVARKTRVAEAERWLRLVGLDGMAGRRPRELSGGEQQRVALVRALAVEPKVLLLDEPLASLDPLVRESLQEVLRGIASSTGVTALMVTHDLAEAMSLGDRTALLHGGRLVAEGSPEEVFLRPPNRTAAELVGVSTFIEGVARDGGVETPAGLLQFDGSAPAGEPVCVAIRPEHVTLAEAEGPNTVAGVVESCSFKGEHWDVMVQTPLGALRARSATPIPSGGQRLVALPARHLFAVMP